MFIFYHWQFCNLPKNFWFWHAFVKFSITSRPEKASKHDIHLQFRNEITEKLCESSLLHLEIYGDISSNSRSEGKWKTRCKPFCEEYSSNTSIKWHQAFNSFPTIHQHLLNCRPSVCHLSNKDEQIV